jgi:Protein of unknown function (DUF550)/Domain of unknown function (DUF4406)
VSAPIFDLVAHLIRQREWSLQTFGPSPRTKGVLDHIRKELAEIESNPGDLSEWIDVVILAFDGAWRAGHEPEVIAATLGGKQARNENRVWPDWRTQSADRAIEHDRSGERRIYIAGPMTGLTDYNYPAFHAAEEQLLSAGYVVLNPARHKPAVAVPTWHDWMRLGIRAVTDSDGVALLPGWAQSRGARAEIAVAESIGVDVRALPDWLNSAAAA